MRNPNYSNLPCLKNKSQHSTVFSPNPVCHHHKKKQVLPSSNPNNTQKQNKTTLDSSTNFQTFQTNTPKHERFHQYSKNPSRQNLPPHSDKCCVRERTIPSNLTTTQRQPTNNKKKKQYTHTF